LFLLVYDPLVRISDNQETAPGLAESWEVSEDGLSWTFHLADGVKWHDGEDFTSADVKFTYDFMMENELSISYLSYLTGVTDVSCPDDNTVVVTTEKPKADMLTNPTPILPEHIWSGMSAEEAATDPNEKMVGTGPYRFDSKGDGFVKIDKNADYFGTGGKVDSFVFIYYENTDSMAQALKIDEIDAAMSLNPAQFGQLKEQENIDAISGSVLGFTQIGVNVYDSPDSGGNPLLKDKIVRQAIHMATDKQKIVDMCYYGAGVPGTVLINPGDYYYYDVPAEDRLDYDAAKSGALLEENGYKDADGDGVREDKDGNKLSFSLISIADNVEEVKAAQVIADGAGQAGIEINLETMDDGALTDAINAADFDLFIWGWGGDLDPSVILNILTSAEIDGSNEPRYSNPEYDRLFTEQSTVIDKAERKKLTDQMQAMAYGDSPYIVMLYDQYIQAYNTGKWTGMKQIPEGTGAFFYNLSAYNYLNVAPK
jgi:peptide/nickel transport system substrate-binding protein